ncbi:MAG: M1 family metallopeptidase [Thermoanaerobaculia bacterium]
MSLIMKRTPGLLSLLAAFVLASSAAATAVTVGSDPAPAAKGVLGSAPPTLRLGDAVRPTHANLELTVVPDRDSFSGSVDFDIEIKSATSLLWLNASELDIRSAAFVVAGRTAAAKILPGGDDFVGFAFDAPLAAGAGRLRVMFTGKFAKVDTRGLFTQKDAENWYAYSQFEATDARRAFPCFDEPSFKIPWQLTLHVKKDHLAVSNTPVLSQADEDGGMKRVVFAETKPLPSYLVALGVGPFDVVDAGRAGKKSTAIRMIVPKGKAAQARYAVETTGPILELLEAYFGTPYPYEKLDNLAVPTTVGFGAMENAGLITYSSNLMLSLPGDSSIRFRRAYASVAAHEMAHQWFGDLVTMAWWNDVWLNESFATWMAGKMMERWKPEWGGLINKVEGRSESMQGDTLVSARRIRQPIETKNDIANAFDNISYGKGGAVLSMFESFLGEEKFQTGVRAYLKKHAFGNATSSDFLAALGSVGGPQVGPSFSSFLDQAGVPLVTAELRCSAGAPARLALSQKRFLPLGSKGSAAQLWQVPVCVKYGVSGPEARACTLLTAESAEIALGTTPGCPGWVLANEGEAGYFRTLYRGQLLQKLVRDQGKALTVPERMGVLGDIHALVQSGELAMADALALVPVFASDPSPQIVNLTAELVESLDDHLVSEETRPRYIQFIQKTFGARARALGLTSRPGENDDTRLLRVSLIGLVGGIAEDAELVKAADLQARRWLDDRQGVDPEMIPNVLTLAARAGGRDLFVRYLAEARKTQDRRERRRLLSVLGAFREAALAKEAFALVLQPTFDQRESFAVINEALGDRSTRTQAYDFVKQNFDALVARTPEASRGGLVRVGNRFCSEPQRADVESFFAKRTEGYEGGPRNLAQTLESISLCAAVRGPEEESVTKFLAAN